MASKTLPIQIWRRIILGLSLAGMAALSVIHQSSSGAPTIDALDPFGGLETLMKLIGGGELIKKIEPGTIVLFGGVVALGVVVSRFFCGWFCAFGALQGIFGWFGKKLIKRRPLVPAKLDGILRYAKYLVLALVLWFTWTTASLIIRPYDPVAAFGHLTTGFPALWVEFGVGFVLLLAVLLLSMVYDRVFCKYLCPLGAFLAILSRIPLFRIKRKADTCISCAKCDKACPMNVKVSTAESVDSPECIACMECVTACPTKPVSLETRLARKKARLSLVVAIGLAIYVGAALVGQLAGARFAAPSLSELAAKGSISVEDIKGTSTYASIASSFGVELERLYRELALDPARVPAEAMVKDTAKLMGLDTFEPPLVRAAVARLTGLPYSGDEEGTTAPTTTPVTTDPAAAVPAPAAAPAAAATATATAGKSTTAPSSAPAPTKPASASILIPEGFALEGTMTIDQVAEEIGASAEAVIAKLGLPASIPRDRALRDMKDEYGYSMPDLKARFK